MGDSSSLLLGLMAYVMACHVIQSPNEVAMPGVVRPIAAMCFLAYPLVDTLGVFAESWPAGPHFLLTGGTSITC